MTDITIPTDVYQQIPYSSGQLVNGNLIFNVPIIMLTNSDGSLSGVNTLIVTAVYLNKTTQTLILGTNYTLSTVANYAGVQVTLLQLLTDCDDIIFARKTVANYNTNYVTQDVKSFLNSDFETAYSAIQEVQAFTAIHDSEITTLQNNLDNKADKTYVDNNFVNNSEKGSLNGVATLDTNGKVPLSQLPVTSETFLGTWKPSTNTPTIANGIGNDGDYYLSSETAFSAFFNQTINLDDKIIYSVSAGNIWQVIPANVYFGVSSVNTRTGAVTLTKADVGLSNVDNTSDLNKPISTATQQALNEKQDIIGNHNIDRILIDDGAGQAIDSDYTVENTVLSANPVTIPTSEVVSNAIGGLTINTSQITDIESYVQVRTDAKVDKILPSLAGNIATLTIQGDVADSGITFTTDGTFFADSDDLVPTQKAVLTLANTLHALAEKLSNKGQPNGYAPLGSDGKIPAQYINIISGFLGTWNASTNTPTITSGVGTNGQWVICSVAGTGLNIDGITSANVGDQLYFNGTIWEKVTAISTVTINGITSSVFTLTLDNILDGLTRKLYTQTDFNDDFTLKNTDDLTEGSTNLYQTSARTLGTVLNGYQQLNTATTFNDTILQGISKKADKLYTDTQLALKADQTTTYTKTEVDSKFTNTVLAGNPTTTTQTAGTNNTTIATTAFVSTAIANIAPKLRVAQTVTFNSGTNFTTPRAGVVGYNISAVAGQATNLQIDNYTVAVSGVSSVTSIHSTSCIIGSGQVVKINSTNGSTPVTVQGFFIPYY